MVLVFLVVKEAPKAGLEFITALLNGQRKSRKSYTLYGDGPDTLLWVIEDYYHDGLGWINLSCSTIYRILVRRRLLFPKASQKINHHPHKYTKGYPGEKVQLDTTEPYGKNQGILLNIIDDYLAGKPLTFIQAKAV